MAFATGITLALCVALFGRIVGLDRERAYYPIVLIVTGSYYVLFAAVGGSSRALLVELIAMGAFTAAAIIGFKHRLWFVVAGLIAHGLFDLAHASIVANPGVPEGWPAFCLAFDTSAAGVLVFLSTNSPWQTSKAIQL